MCKIKYNCGYYQNYFDPSNFISIFIFAIVASFKFWALGGLIKCHDQQHADRARIRRIPWSIDLSAKSYFFPVQPPMRLLMIWFDTFSFELCRQNSILSAKFVTYNLSLCDLFGPTSRSCTFSNVEKILDEFKNQCAPSILLMRHSYYLRTLPSISSMRMRNFDYSCSIKI